MIEILHCPRHHLPLMAAGNCMDDGRIIVACEGCLDAEENGWTLDSLIGRGESG